MISPALQRGVAKSKTQPESRRDGAHSCNVFAEITETLKPVPTPQTVELQSGPQIRGHSMRPGKLPASCFCHGQPPQFLNYPLQFLNRAA